jgi:uncharacterized membrane protein YfcA
LSSIEIDLILGLLLFSTGLVAGTVDAIAGGGGLISLPMLIGVGVPAPIALGTNKLQSAFGTSMAAWHFFKKGAISLKEMWSGLLFGALGASLGAFTAQITHPDLLQKMIPAAMLLVFTYTLFSPRVGLIDKKPRMSQSLFYTLFGFVLSFYDGLLGPGTGSFWIIALVFFLGFNMVKATAYTKVFNLNSNLIALSWFIMGGQIDYVVAIIMALGQLIGGRLGSHFALAKGAALVRPCFLGIVLITMAVMVYRCWF